MIGIDVDKTRAQRVDHLEIGYGMISGDQKKYMYTSDVPDVD